ncbi:glycosyl hydrolase family 28 protein [Candidatus Epulonipiscium viviparus]|uniref:alpha-1,3-galactosidase-related protein n=1 Tax=Candidatus Epulonipiscium viviparus TaxID=420336 RepID=UPI00016C0B42|nr:glycosyl hydrolase family 28 protein [Candidatus Epulopiscium viviparus]
MKTINVTQEMIANSRLGDFTHYINELIEAVEDDTVINIEKGHYDLRTTYARNELCYISNNDSGVKSLAFAVYNKNNIVIDGNGSSLNGVGRILPFYVFNCKNVTIKNFEIDFQRAFTSQGEVLEASKNEVTLKIDKAEFPYEIRQNTIRFMGEDYKSDFVKGMLEFYKGNNRPVADAFDNSVQGGLPAEEIEEGVVKIFSRFRKIPMVGNILTIKHEERLVPAVTIDRSDTVKVENLRIKQSGTMGVVAQLSKDITVSKIDISPSNTRVFSTNTDATHFVNCQGTVIVENCKLESMFDDVINVHGNYLRVAKVFNDKCVLLEIPHYQQYGFFNLLKGNKISICDQPTMLELGYSAVADFKKINNKYYEVSLTDAFDFEEGQTYCVDNLSMYPKVIFRNNVCGKNRARGLILTSTKETIVEGNIIDSEGSAIKVNSDMSNWYESGAISTLIIRNNKLTRKNHGNWGEALIDIDPKMKEQVNGKFYHGEMIIENNEISLDESPLFYGYSFKKVTIQNNTINMQKDLSEDFYIQTENCGEVVVKENTICKTNR